MITFDIEPYVGAGPIRFGMKPKEVEELIGPCDSASQDYFGEYGEERKYISLGYSTDGLVEAVFAPGAIVAFRAVSLFGHPDPINFLMQFDDSPFEWVGFIIFLKLGLRLSGFHDGEESQKAIGAVRRGRWDEYANDFRRFRAGKRPGQG